MNNKTIAEMICILDKSGSMYGKEQDTIENYNRMLAELKKLPGETYITTALFSEHCRLLYHHIPVQNAKDLTEKDYYTEGDTALFDAIGEMLTTPGTAASEDKTAPVSGILVFIITDGMENASRHYDLQDVRNLIQEKQAAGWEILFFGTDMDVLELAQKTGIKKENTFQYSPDTLGIRSGYQTAEKRFSQLRSHLSDN